MYSQTWLLEVELVPEVEVVSEVVLESDVELELVFVVEPDEPFVVELWLSVVD